MDTGMLIRWIKVRHRPMAMGAKPAGARESVAPMITKRNMAVITTSHSSTAIIEYLPGDKSPNPLLAKPPGCQPACPLARWQYRTARPRR